MLYNLFNTMTLKFLTHEYERIYLKMIYEPFRKQWIIRVCQYDLKQSLTISCFNSKQTFKPNYSHQNFSQNKSIPLQLQYIWQILSYLKKFYHTY